MLASAGDDGNVLLWIPSELRGTAPAIGEDGLEDKETWRIKHMCRSSGSEIYDLAWSPDGAYFITGSMDNIARIYQTQTGTVYRVSSRSHVASALNPCQARSCDSSRSTITTSRESHGIP